MPITPIDRGQFANDPEADTLYEGSLKINDNFNLVDGNIFIQRGVRYNEGDTFQDIVNKVNNLPNYYVNEKNNVLFSASQAGAGFSNGYIPIFKYILLNKSTGYYGQGGTQVTQGDLSLVYDKSASASDILNADNTQEIPYILSENQNISDWLNTQVPSINIQNANDGYRVFTGENGTYFFLGDGGLYGANSLQSTMNMFELFGGQPITPSPPSQYIIQGFEIITTSQGDTIQDNRLIGKALHMIYKNNMPFQSNAVSFDSSIGKIFGFDYDPDELITIQFTQI